MNSLKGKTLWLFNLETNLDSSLLAVSHTWISEFAKYFDQVEVYSTHVGRHSLPLNVHVNEIGGGSFPKRIQGLFTLLTALMRISGSRNSSLVFHHMSPRTAAFLAVPLKLLSVRQFIWYSHSHTSTGLKVMKSLMDRIFTASPESVSFNSRNLRYVRNGVPGENFQDVEINGPRNGIVSVGRISPVKNLDILLNEVSKLDSLIINELKLICFAGPVGNEISYEEKLRRTKIENSLPVEFIGVKPYSELPEFLSRFSIYYTGTKGGVDKAALEAGLSGCFVVSENYEALRLVGMQEVYESIGIKHRMTLSEQVKTILTNPLLNGDKRRMIQEFGIRHNTLERVIEKIVKEVELVV
jgi:glycosyltransferase involved in cell wall biosynthesis